MKLSIFPSQRLRLPSAALLLTLLLSGCVTPPPVTTQTSQWLSHQQQLETLKYWQLRGKVALFTEKNRRSANLFWQQHDERSEMRLSGPLGKELLSLHFSPGQVKLKVDGEEHQGQDAEQLLYELTGWTIPVSSLPNWLLGLPAEHQYQLSDAHRLAEITSQDQHWQVAYQNYQDVSPYILPRQLSITGVETRIKLSINQWQIDQ